MYLPQLEAIPRLELLGAPTALSFLPRLSDYAGREIFIKRDDLTPLGLGGNKLRKLEYLAAEAVSQGADVLLTAGAIQSNHVRQTACVAAKLGMHWVALLENPLNAAPVNYLENGNRFLLGLSDVEVVNVQHLDNPEQQLQEQAVRLEAQGFRPYIVPVGGSNAIGAMGYVSCAREIALQCEDLSLAAIVVASGSAGTHAGLAVGIQHWMPDTQVTGVTVSRIASEQRVKVAHLAGEITARLALPELSALTLWDEFCPSLWCA
ncbi:MAG: D-cysteine desulfhydrase [Candidatus Erwinia impunctatus]|nr:D-cysteine desulfhydrase [Culicoides impunctatus]